MIKIITSGLVFAGCNSISALAVISVVRYMMVYKPCGFPGITYTVTKVCFLISWGNAFIWAGAPVVGWSRYSPEGPGTWCSVDWMSRTPENITYIVFIFLACYFLPVVLIATSYTMILRKIKQVGPNNFR